MSLKKQLFLVCGAIVMPFLGLHADNVNVALHKPVTASSQQKEFPASNVTDGIVSRKSTWMSGNSARPPHTLDINLERWGAAERLCQESCEAVIKETQVIEKENFSMTCVV